MVASRRPPTWRPRAPEGAWPCAGNRDAVRIDEMPTARLLAIPASHACAVAAAMLDAKHVPYQRVDLFPGLSRAWLRATGFAGGTVPALRIDGTRIQGSRAIARALDDGWPDPPLFPADPTQRRRTEEIETWGDGPLQMTARRIILRALCHSSQARAAALQGARLQFHFPGLLPGRALTVLGVRTASEPSP
jgi:glutathione S-transferase